MTGSSESRAFSQVRSIDSKFFFLRYHNHACNGRGPRDGLVHVHGLDRSIEGSLTVSQRQLGDSDDQLATEGVLLGSLRALGDEWRLFSLAWSLLVVLAWWWNGLRLSRLRTGGQLFDRRSSLDGGHDVKKTLESGSVWPPFASLLVQTTLGVKIYSETNGHLVMKHRAN